LIGLFSCPSSVAASSIFSLLGADTSWANVKNTVHMWESRDSVGMSMGIEEIAVARVSEALMP